MNTPEYFRRAHEDPSFRRKQLGDQRYYRNVNLGIFVSMTVLGIGLTLYDGLQDGEWLAGLVIAGPLVISTAIMHTVFRTRIAALQTMARDEPVAAVSQTIGA